MPIFVSFFLYKEIGVHLLDISRGGRDFSDTFSLQRAERGALIRYSLCLLVDMGKYYHKKESWLYLTQQQGRKKKKTGWLHSKGILKSLPLYILRHIQTLNGKNPKIYF
jgi:hypothetical protein